jgi:glycerol dehydrogenase
MEYEKFDRNFGLDGKTAIISGAVQGIGLAIAELFAEKGASLLLVDLKEDVVKTAGSINSNHGRAVPMVMDLTSSGAADKVVETAISEFGNIDILVNNAGIVALNEAEDLSVDDWDKTMAVNLRAPFLLAQAAGKRMISSGGGKIINMASQAGLVALDRHIAYCASKAGIISITRTLAAEWGEYNINVNSISPTVILTELGKKAWSGEVGEQMKKKIPIGRFGLPDEVAAVVLFLASNASNLITGENIVIDGGYTIQ